MAVIIEMRKFFRKPYPTKKRASLRKKKKVAYKPKKSLTEKVNTLIRAVETKQSVSGDAIPMRGAQTAGFAAQVLPLYPTNGYLLINRGVGSNQRTGNRCTVKNAYMRMTFNINPQLNPANDEGIQPYYIKIMAFRFKNQQVAPTVVNVANYMQTTFFEGTAGLDVGISGGPQDHLFPVNEENYSILYSRTLKIGYSTQVWGATTGAANAAVIPYYSYGNNDFPMTVVHKVNCTKFLQKHLVFPDDISGTNQTVTNIPPVFLAAWLIPANGTQFDTEAWEPVLWNYRYEVKFTDA